MYEEYGITQEQYENILNEYGDVNYYTIQEYFSNLSIEISNKTARNNNPYVVADGQKDVILELGATLELSVSETPALLINLGFRSEVETLHRGFLEQMIRELGY